MGNALEFILKLTDMLTPGMRVAAGATDTAAGKIVADLEKIKSTGASVGGSNFGSKIANQFNAPIAKVKEFSNELDKIKQKSTGSNLLSGMATGLSSFAGPMLVAAGIAAAGAFVSSSVSAAMQYGATKQSFSVLTGSEKTGNALANDLNKLQQNTILGPEVFKNAQTMLGFGLASEKVVPTLKMLGDISMGNADKMGSLTLAFSQVTAAGKLTGQDLLQFINAGFNPLNQIAKDTGVSMGELKKKMEDGAISSDMIALAMKNATSEGGLYYDMLNKLADTPAGKLAKLQGAFEGLKIKVGEALMPLQIMGLDALNSLLEIANTVIPYIVQGVQFIKDGFNGLTNGTSQWSGIISQVANYVNIVWSGISHVAAAIWHIVSGVVTWLGNSQILKDVFSGVLFVISSVASVLWTVVKGVADVLVWIWDSIVKPILDAIEWAYNKVKSLLGLATENPITVVGSVNNTLSPSLQNALMPGAFGLPQTAAPLLPGMSGAKNVVTPVTANAGGAYAGLKDTKGGAAGKRSADGINSGGQRSIIVNIAKMIGAEEIHVMGAGEVAGEIESAVKEAVRRMVYSFNGVAAN